VSWGGALSPPAPHPHGQAEAGGLLSREGLRLGDMMRTLLVHVLAAGRITFAWSVTARNPTATSPTRP
jgi:hypothetical protein